MSVQSVVMSGNGKDFSFDTVQGFDKHISLSVLGYSHMVELIKSMATFFITPGSNVYDIGCSTGNLLFELNEVIKVDNVKYIGYDLSTNLLPKAKNDVYFFRQDVTDSDVTFSATNLVICAFTLQFIKPAKRQELITKIYNSLNERGAFIFVEKIYSAEGYTQDIFNSSHYDFKLRAFTPEEILGKQDKLREIMKPLTARENVQLLKNAGFKNINTFYQSLNFKGWIAIK